MSTNWHAATCNALRAFVGGGWTLPRWEQARILRFCLDELSYSEELTDIEFNALADLCWSALAIAGY